MKKSDLENWYLAEAIYNFVGQDETFEDFCRHCETEDLSIAEYVSRYKFEEFAEWLKSSAEGSVTSRK